MIVSKFGKSYDTSDGSEQHFDAPGVRAAPSLRTVQSDGQAAGQRWEDDGGPLNDAPYVEKLTCKPPWSVLSLRDLNEAIRREELADDPARLKLEFDRAERRAIRAIELYKERTAAGARAKRNRYGNAWEHTLM